MKNLEIIHFLRALADKLEHAATELRDVRMRIVYDDESRVDYLHGGYIVRMPNGRTTVTVSYYDPHLDRTDELPSNSLEDA